MSFLRGTVLLRSLQTFQGEEGGRTPSASFFLIRYFTAGIDIRSVASSNSDAKTRFLMFDNNSGMAGDVSSYLNGGGHGLLWGHARGGSTVLY